MSSLRPSNNCSAQNGLLAALGIHDHRLKKDGIELPLLNRKTWRRRWFCKRLIIFNTLQMFWLLISIDFYIWCSVCREKSPSALMLRSCLNSRFKESQHHWPWHLQQMPLHLVALAAVPLVATMANMATMAAVVETLGDFRPMVEWWFLQKCSFQRWLVSMDRSNVGGQDGEYSPSWNFEGFAPDINSG